MSPTVDARPRSSAEVPAGATARLASEFKGRQGHMKTAIEAGVPIVPMVSIGSQEGHLYQNRGMWLAKRLGLKERMRTDVLPLSFGFPSGSP